MKTISLLSMGALVLGALATGCEGNAPEASIRASSPEMLVAADDAHDDLLIRVHYVDPNGDLGGGRIDVVDCRREGLVTSYELAPIATQGAVEAGADIEGELDVLVPDVGFLEDTSAPAKKCTDAGAPATAFCVVLVDTAGVESAPACTGAVRIVAMN